MARTSGALREKPPPSAGDITEHKQAEEALWQSQVELSTIWDNAPMVMILVDQERRVRKANLTAAKFAQRATEEMRGLHGGEALRCIHSVDAPRGCGFGRYCKGCKVREVVLDTFETGNDHYQVETKLQFASRQEGVSFLVSTTLLNLAEGQRVLVCIEDITEHKRAEEALRRSERQASAAIEAARGFTFNYDIATGKVNWGGAIKEITGYTPEEFAQVDVNGWAEMIHPDAKDRVLSMLQEAIQVKDRATAEYRFRTKKGGYVTLSSISLTEKKDGKAVRLVGILQDITERKQVEEELAKYRRHLEELVEERTRELKDAQEELERVFDLSVDMICIADIDGYFRKINPAFEKTLGYTSQELLSRPFLDFVHPEDRDNTLGVIKEKLSVGASVIDFENRYLCKDGSYKWLAWTSHPIPVEGIPYGVARDITERKQAREKLERQYEKEKKLRQQLEDEMKKRVEFTRALAHELKTPRTPVVMSSELLTSELKDETLLRVARNISRGAANLNSRIDELLDLARGEMGMLKLKTEPIDALSLLREVIEDVAAMASNKGQSMVSRLPHSLPLISADRTRLRQIVLNLLNNAFKFTPDGGEITLRARQEDGDLVVEVQDTGRGIAEEEQQRLFEPYHRVDADRERMAGLGLGLALCRTLVELHGGRIWVESARQRLNLRLLTATGRLR